MPTSSHMACSFSSRVIRLSTGNSPRKFEPQLALQPMPASLTVQFLGLGHSLRPGLHFLHLGAVGVAAGEHVAHVGGTETGVGVALDGQGRRVLAGALHAAGVQGQGGVGDAGLGGEAGDNLVYALHLGRPLGADERADYDILQGRCRKAGRGAQSCHQRRCSRPRFASPRAYPLLCIRPSGSWAFRGLLWAIS